MMTPEQEAAWLAERKKGIGGSDAGAVLAAGYGCPRALFLDKTGVEPNYDHTEQEKNNFKRGHALEPLVAARFVQETSAWVKRMDTRVSKERPWMRVNIDRMIPSQEWTRKQDLVGPGYLECKTANANVFADFCANGMPEHYILQLQHGLAVTGWQWGVFALLCAETWAFRWFVMKRHAKLIDDVILPQEEAFWKRVQAGEIPAALPDFNDSRCEKCVYRRGCRNAEALPKVKERKPVYATDDAPEFAEMVAQYKRLDASIADLEALKQQTRAAIQAHMGNRSHVLCPGEAKKFTNVWQNGSLRWDTKALDAEQSHLADKYKRRGEGGMQLRSYDLNAKDAA